MSNKPTAKAHPLRHDLMASIVVFLIALPFSMGVALASGAPIHAGLIPGAIAAIVAGLMGGAPLVVSGPAATVSVLVYEMSETHGLAAIGAATAVAGIMQLVLGSMRVGHHAARIPAGVVHGMMAGVGIMMATGQLAVIFGHSPKKGLIDNILALPHIVSAGNYHAAGIGLLTLAVLIAWPRIGSSKVPGSLVGILAAALATTLLELELPKIELPETLWQLSWPHVPSENIVAWLGAALAIALIASTESLLSAVAVDKLHDGPRANLNRELIGQGFANMVSGLLGGLPITGGSVRSTANMHAGAKTRMSTVLHGVWLVGAATLLTAWLEHVPLAALGGLLLLVSVRLINLTALAEARANRELTLYLVTLFGVLGWGLLWGIGMGLLAAVVQSGLTEMRRRHVGPADAVALARRASEVVLPPPSSNTDELDPTV